MKMMRSGILAVGLALTLSCAGARAQDQETRVRTTEQGTMLRGPMWAESISSPMQEFVSHEVHEILDLSRHLEQFRAANRPELVRVMQHMIRDHTLVKDAARSVLARQGKESKPVRMEMEPMAEGPEAFIRRQIELHEKHLADSQQLLAQAGTPEERSVYQQAVRDTRKHLNWLRRLDQGQPVRIGAFGPTTPLARIAGYREQLRSGSMRRRSGSRAAGGRRRR
jgi:hypothetical protein